MTSSLLRVCPHARSSQSIGSRYEIPGNSTAATTAVYPRAFRAALRSRDLAVFPIVSVTIEEELRSSTLESTICHSMPLEGFAPKPTDFIKPLDPVAVHKRDGRVCADNRVVDLPNTNSFTVDENGGTAESGAWSTSGDNVTIEDIEQTTGVTTKTIVTTAPLKVSISSLRVPIRYVLGKISHEMKASNLSYTQVVASIFTCNAGWIGTRKSVHDVVFVNHVNYNNAAVLT